MIFVVKCGQNANTYANIVNDDLQNHTIWWFMSVRIKVLRLHSRAKCAENILNVPIIFASTGKHRLCSMFFSFILEILLFALHIYTLVNTREKKHFRDFFYYTTNESKLKNSRICKSKKKNEYNKKQQWIWDKKTVMRWQE